MGPLFEPSRGSTLAVAALLFLSALICPRLVARLGFWGVGLPRWLSLSGVWTLILVFFLRAVGDFRWVGFSKREHGSRFAAWDSWLYSPSAFCWLWDALRSGWLLSSLRAADHDDYFPFIRDLRITYPRQVGRDHRKFFGYEADRRSASQAIQQGKFQRLFMGISSLHHPPVKLRRSERQRNFSSASIVSLGRSSSTQCPVSFSTTTVTSEATNFICRPSTSPDAFSPPITRTGIVSLVLES